jgi:hypothetical protein
MHGMLVSDGESWKAHHRGQDVGRIDFEHPIEFLDGPTPHQRPTTREKDGQVKTERRMPYSSP